MTKWTRWVLAGVLCCLPVRALAVAKATTPPSSIFARSVTVVAGKVTAVAPTGDNTTIDATVETLKGSPIGDVIKVRVEGLPNVAAKVKVGSPLVMFVGSRAASSALHLSDTWLFPEVVKGTNFRVAKDSEALFRQSYPGTTSALLAIVTELTTNAGKYSMLDAVTEEMTKAMFRGGVKELGKVDATGWVSLKTILGRTVVALSANDAKAFDVGATGLTPNTDAPPFAAADVIAVRAGPNGALLTLKRTGELTPGGGPAVPLWKDGTTASAAAFGKFGEDDRNYAIVVKDDNVIRYPLPGEGEPADFLRLTGERIGTYHKENAKWLAGASAAAVDANGDGRTDVLINSPTAGPMLLVNRGFGTFFVDTDVAKVLKTAAGEPLIGAKALWTAVDVDGDKLDDLLIMSEGGAVTAVMNTKAQEKK